MIGLALAWMTGLVSCGSRTGFDVDTGTTNNLVATGGNASNAVGGNGGVSSVTGGASSTTSHVTSCQQYQDFTVGSYIVETNYWNFTGCPGTQCLDVDTTTGSFVVTQGPNCGDTVATYPNVLYGSAFGAVSPNSGLPKQVSALSRVTSDWSFSVGGTATDHYDVAYDIWFCPNRSCGQNGFPGGLELMIWLDYQNTYGWQRDLGSVNLSGYNWEVWTFTQGSGANAWTYLAYLIQPTMVTSVTNFDLLAFFKDAETRGYLQSSWYLYAVQAGDEIRSGGLPYANNGFSVSVQ